MTDNADKKAVAYDTSLTRQTGGKLYATDDNGALQVAGQWCFQFSDENPDFLNVIVTLSGSSSMALAMGAPMNSQGELSKASTLQLKSWLADILQQMSQQESLKPVLPATN